MKPSCVSGPSSQPLLGETIGACFDRIATAHPDADALVSCHQSLRYTYAGLRTEVERIARGLLALGVEPGDRVGIWSPNCAEWLIPRDVRFTADFPMTVTGKIQKYRMREISIGELGLAGASGSES